MKRLFLLMLLALPFAFAFSCDRKGPGKAQSHVHAKQANGHYTCSMHPQIKKDKPGKCPICSMELVWVEGSEGFEIESEHKEIDKVWSCKDYPDITSHEPGECPVDGTPMVEVTAQEEEEKIVAKVSLAEKQARHFRAALFKVRPMNMEKRVRLLGRMVQAEERKSFMPARVSGRVEKVFVESEGQFVGVGQPVLLLYSPELISAGEEYLMAVKNLKQTTKSGKPQETFQSLARRAREKLKLWGVLDGQLKSWLSKGKVPEKITIYSHVAGIVIKRYAREGAYFREGQNFFSVVDLSVLWVELDVYEHDTGMVKLGQKVSFTSKAYPGSEWGAEIDFINPLLNERTRTLTVRATVNNKEGKLKPGMIVDANLKIVLGEGCLAIPRTAVIDTGKRKVAWLDMGDDRYVARNIKTGFESEGFVEVKSGLKQGDMVVAQGNFLLDAQAELFGGYETGDVVTNSTTSSGHQH